MPVLPEIYEMIAAFYGPRFARTFFFPLRVVSTRRGSTPSRNGDPR